RLHRSNLDGDIELRVVRFYIPRAIFGAEALDHLLHFIGVRNGRRLTGGLRAVGSQAYRWRLQHVLVPLAVRSHYREQKELGALPDEPNRMGDCTSSDATGCGELDLVSVHNGLLELCVCHVQVPPKNVSSRAHGASTRRVIRSPSTAKREVRSTVPLGKFPTRRVRATYVPSAAVCAPPPSKGCLYLATGPFRQVSSAQVRGAVVGLGRQRQQERGPLAAVGRRRWPLPWTCSAWSFQTTISHGVGRRGYGAGWRSWRGMQSEWT